MRRVLIGSNVTITLALWLLAFRLLGLGESALGALVLGLSVATFLQAFFWLSIQMHVVHGDAE
jgi:hypothetical protein